MFPVCVACTRNARTVDTPRVKVRVASAVVSRDVQGLRLICRCHGAVSVTFLVEPCEESDLETKEVFDEGR